MDTDDKMTLALAAIVTLALLAYTFGFVSSDGIGFMVPGLGGYFWQF